MGPEGQDKYDKYTPRTHTETFNLEKIERRQGGKGESPIFKPENKPYLDEIFEGKELSTNEINGKILKKFDNEVQKTGLGGNSDIVKTMEKNFSKEINEIHDPKGKLEAYISFKKALSEVGGRIIAEKNTQKKDFAKNEEIAKTDEKIKKDFFSEIGEKIGKHQLEYQAKRDKNMMELAKLGKDDTNKAPSNLESSILALFPGTQKKQGEKQKS